MMKIILNLKVYRDIKGIENYMMHSDLLTMRERSREREEVIQKKKDALYFCKTNSEHL